MKLVYTSVLLGLLGCGSNAGQVKEDSAATRGTAEKLVLGLRALYARDLKGEGCQKDGSNSTIQTAKVSLENGTRVVAQTVYKNFNDQNCKDLWEVLEQDYAWQLGKRLDTQDERYELNLDCIKFHDYRYENGKQIEDKAVGTSHPTIYTQLILPASQKDKVCIAAATQSEDEEEALFPGAEGSEDGDKIPIGYSAENRASFLVERACFSV